MKKDIIIERNDNAAILIAEKFHARKEMEARSREFILQNPTNSSWVFGKYVARRAGKYDIAGIVLVENAVKQLTAGAEGDNGWTAIHCSELNTDELALADKVIQSVMDGIAAKVTSDSIAARKSN